MARSIPISNESRTEIIELAPTATQRRADEVERLREENAQLKRLLLRFCDAYLWLNESARPNAHARQEAAI